MDTEKIKLILQEISKLFDELSAEFLATEPDPVPDPAPEPTPDPTPEPVPDPDTESDPTPDPEPDKPVPLPSQPSSNRTVFDTGTSITVSTQNEFNSALNSNFDFINLKGTFSYPRNGLKGLVRPANKPLVIRTDPESPVKSKVLGFLEDTPVYGLALVNLEVDKINIRGGGDILIEDVTGNLDLQGERSSGVPGKSLKNVNIRFCNCSDNWTMSASAFANGLFMYNYEDLLIEYSIFDHNGWKPGADRSLDPNSGGPVIRGHNVYLASPGKGSIIVRNNIFSRASSHGIHFRAGGLLKNNLFIRNPISWQYGYGGDNYVTKYGVVQGGYVEDNVAVGSDDINTSTGDMRGIFGWLTCCNGVNVKNNLCVLNNTSPVNDAVFLIEQNFEVKANFTGNRAYKWGGGIIFRKSGFIPQIVENSNNYDMVTYQQEDLANLIIKDEYIDTVKKTGIDPKIFSDLMSKLNS